MGVAEGVLGGGAVGGGAGPVDAPGGDGEVAGGAHGADGLALSVGQAGMSASGGVGGRAVGTGGRGFLPNSTFRGSVPPQRDRSAKLACARPTLRGSWRLVSEFDSPYPACRVVV